ncbi:hypothetical protein EJ02DRAFT_454265 [Clathrospora elynae]|uniref:Uncharacterized protein n=1 Tax=Clathrospora elynae TaxID=706981 RepID=A0A6A5SRJ0_9PLEO|nr:hypothetical protein EJ02DRAFT_454265 [Clathrospora elynae]
MHYIHHRLWLCQTRSSATVTAVEVSPVLQRTNSTSEPRYNLPCNDTSTTIRIIRHLYSYAFMSKRRRESNYRGIFKADELQTTRMRMTSPTSDGILTCTLRRTRPSTSSIHSPYHNLQSTSNIFPSLQSKPLVSFPPTPSSPLPNLIYNPQSI